MDETSTQRAAFEAIEPIVSLGFQAAGSGTYQAVMTVSGLTSETQAQAVLDHMQRLFCGQQQGQTHDA